MKLKYIYIFLITILLLPLNFAELQPAFLDKDTHYLGEVIDLGLSGLIEDEPAIVTVVIEYSNNQVYLTTDINLDEQPNLEITIPEQIYDNKLKISYIFKENENYNKSYNLDFENKPINTSLDFCVEKDCYNKNLVFYENKELSITTKNSNARYTIFIKSKDGILDSFENVNLPQIINLPVGDYTVYGYLIFNDSKFKIDNISFSIIRELTENKKTWKNYFSEINTVEKEFDGAIIQEESNIIQPTTFDNIDTENKKPNFVLYGVFGATILLLLAFIFLKPKKENKSNRRENRANRVLLLFVSFIFILNFVTALSIQEKRGEYSQLEIDFDTFNNLYKYPEKVYLSIDETKLSDTVLIPISATGLSDLENIIPKTDLENGFNTELLPVLFAKNINLIDLTNYRLPVAGCEQILYWYDENPVTSDPKTIINRQRTKLQENIIINSENTNSQINTNNCISDLIQKEYLVEKRVLLKITYTTDNIENKTTLFTKLKFFRNGEDVTTSSFLGNDLNNINIMVDFFNASVTEQTLVLSGIAENRTNKEITPDVTHTNIINLNSQDNISFTLNAQLLDLELPNTAYGAEMDFGNELGDYRFGGQKFYISNSNFRNLKRELLKNISLSGTITYRNNNPSITFNQESKRMLAELKLNPLKYLVLKENNIINISENSTIGITISAGIIIEENTQYTLFLGPDKILKYPPTNENTHVYLVNSVFQKIAQLKDLEKTQHVLKLLFILDFKSQDYTQINSSADLYFKTHSKIIEQIHAAYSSDFEKNLIYNQVLSLTWFICIQSIDETPKESCLSRDNVFLLNYGILENITTPEKIHRNTIFDRKVSLSRLYYNPYLASKNLNSRQSVLLVNSGIEQYFNKKHIPAGTLSENVTISGNTRQIERRIDTEVATELKSVIYSVLSDNNVTNQNLAYYKDLMSIPFHKVALEQKGCWQEERAISSETFSNDLCIYNYNIRRNTYGVVTNLNNFYEGSNHQGYELLPEEYKFVAINAHKALLLIEDISEIDRSGRPIYDSNSFTFKKMRIMVSLIELYDAYGMHTEALMLAQKLNNIFELNKRKLNESLSRNDILAIQTQIESINKLILKNTTARLKNTLIIDKTYRVDTYTEIGETSWDRYKTKVTTGGNHSLWSDQLTTWLTGGHINSTYRSIFGRPLQEVKNIETENYNKLINGAKCLEKFVELDWTNSEITVFVNTGFTPRGKRTTLTDRSWSDEQYCRRDLQELLNYKFYEDAANIINYSKIGQTRTPIYDYLTPNYSAGGFRLDIDEQIQLTQTKAYLKEIREDYEPDLIQTILRTIDEGINPLAIVITIATAGFSVGFNVPLGSVAKSANVLAKTVGQRIVYELGENVVVDSALGTFVYYTKPRNPALLIMVGLLIGGSVNKTGNVAFAIKQIDTVTDSLADSIRLSLNLSDTPAINQNIKDAIKNGLLTEYQDQTALLLRLKQTNQIPENIFSVVGKSNLESSLDDSLITTLRNNLRQNNIRITNSQLQEILVNNQAYLMYKNTQIKELIRLKNNNILIPELSDTITKTNLTREIPNRFGMDFTDISKEFEDLRAFNEIDPEHFARPTRIIYDDLGNPFGYEMEKIYGTTLADYIENGGVLDDTFYRRIEDSVKKLHAQGYAHGDINPYNVLLRQTYDGLDFTIIDPVGYGRIIDNINLRNNLDAAINDDLVKVRNLKNYTTTDQLLFQTNRLEIPMENAWLLQRMQQNGEFIPIRRSDNTTITFAKINNISDDGQKIIVEFTENGVKYNRETDYKFINFMTLTQNRTFIVRGIGEGTIQNIEPNKIVTFKLNNGETRYIDLDLLIDSSYDFNPVKNKSINLTSNGKRWVIWGDDEMEVFTPIRKNDLVYLDGVGGKITDVYDNGNVNVLLNNGTIRNTTVNTIIESRKLRPYLNTMDYSDITPDSLESFITSNQKLPERFVYMNRNGWDGREVILVDKLNDPILKEYLAAVKRNINGNANIQTKIDTAFALVEYAMPIYKTSGIDLLKDIADYTSISGEVVPIGYLINNKVGVCRHKALLLKITLDEMGIDSQITRGDFVSVRNGIESKGGHAWVELKTPNGENIILDPMHHNKIPYTSRPPQYQKIGDIEMYKPKSNNPIPYNNLRNVADGADIYRRTARLQNYLTNELHKYNLNPTEMNDFTFKNNITRQITDPNFLAQIGSTRNDLDDLMKLQNLRIKEIYQNDGLLLTLNHKLSLTSIPANTREEIISQLGRKNISVNIVDDWTIRKFDDPDNFATLNLNNPQNPIIEIERSAYNDPNRFLREMRHEYGALLLSKQYGSKSEIPLFFKPSGAGEIEPVWATHYLDHYMDKGYNKLFSN